MKLIVYLVVLFLGTLAWFTGCRQEETLTDSERAAVLAFSEPAADDLFAGLRAGDYAAFSRDFDTDLQESLPADDFAAWKQDLEGTFGNYLSHKVDQITRSDEFYVVVYQATFEGNDGVLVEVVFHAVNPHEISHLGFDSEKLRQE